MSEAFLEETSPTEWNLEHSDDFSNNIKIGFKKSDKK